MPAIRIRQPFLGKTTPATPANSQQLTPAPAAFVVLVLASAYLGLSTQVIPSYGQSDKGLHFITFLLLTVSSTRLSTRQLCASLTLLS